MSDFWRDRRQPHRRFAAGGSGPDQRDPRDIEIERLNQRIRELEFDLQHGDASDDRDGRDDQSGTETIVRENENEEEEYPSFHPDTRFIEPTCVDEQMSVYNSPPIYDDYGDKEWYLWAIGSSDRCGSNEAMELNGKATSVVVEDLRSDQILPAPTKGTTYKGKLDFSLININDIHFKIQNEVDNHVTVKIVDKSLDFDKDNFPKKISTNSPNILIYSTLDKNNILFVAKFHVGKRYDLINIDGVSGHHIGCIDVKRQLRSIRFWYVPIDFQVPVVHTSASKVGAELFKRVKIIVNGRRSNASFDPGGTSIEPSEITRKVKLFWRVRLPVNQKWPTVISTQVAYLSESNWRLAHYEPMFHSTRVAMV